MKPNLNYTLLAICLLFFTTTGFVSCKNETKKEAESQELFFDLSLAQWSLNRSFREGGISPYEFAKLANEMGFTGLEYVSQLYKDVYESEDKAAALAAFVEKNNTLAAQYKMKNVLIMIDGEGDLSSSDEEERTTAEENHKQWIDAAHQMGCSAIRVNLHGEKDEALWIENSIKSLNTLASYAEPLGINVIVENHGGKSSNAGLLMKVINQVSYSNCGTLPDFGNFCLSENWGSLKDNKCDDPYDPYLGVSQMLPKAFGMSAKSFEFDAEGEETILDYHKLLSIIKEGGYTGFIGVEFEGDGLSEKEGIMATKRLLEKAAAKL